MGKPHLTPFNTNLCGKTTLNTIQHQLVWGNYTYHHSHQLVWQNYSCLAKWKVSEVYYNSALSRDL